MTDLAPRQLDAIPAAAEQLLAAILAAAEQHGATLDDFDWSVDLPGGCLDVVRARTSD